MKYPQGRTPNDQADPAEASVKEAPKQQGDMGEDKHGNVGHTKVAFNLWHRSIPKSPRATGRPCPEVLAKMQVKVAKLPVVDLPELLQQGEESKRCVVLEHIPAKSASSAITPEEEEGHLARGCPKGPPIGGNTLRVWIDGFDFCGGVGKYATLWVEAVPVQGGPTPSLQVRFLNGFGRCLRAKEDGSLDGSGKKEDSDCIFELFPRYPAPRFSLAPLGGTSMIGTFLARKNEQPAPNPAEPQKEENPQIAMARKTMEEDPNYQGRRCWQGDGFVTSPYTFDQYVRYYIRRGWGGPTKTGAYEAAKTMWEEGTSVSLASPAG
jgi:hypothetical protein